MPSLSPLLAPSCFLSPAVLLSLSLPRSFASLRVLRCVSAPALIFLAPCTSTYLKIGY